ncbi:hypothetical protein D9758_012013 [Tetrapyrgos nigripes]|uniref:Uncharacterized protein n=1 Tax=Tetrapyrgos nigripes TaxID=182062 RepID=A0A8H5FR14_9AGAR|nr:hypothetical protein D9758_012013 [Tetrapyrgos nigripes]
MRSCSIARLALRPPPPLSRSFSVSSSRRFPEDETPKDFRPPWVYTLSRLAIQWSIPAVGIYAVFLYDFGDQEHVFSPIRRWTAKQKAAFFAPSPEEKQLLDNKEDASRKI